VKYTKDKPKQTCSDCVHYWACAAWNVGSIANMDGTNCVNFERYNLPDHPPKQPEASDLTLSKPEQLLQNPQ